jgi:hypothetical protein
MSLFLAWHTLALVIAPMPPSQTTTFLRTFLQPYLSLLKLDNKWDFYAPGIDPWRQFRYVIDDSAGNAHSFAPSEKLSHFHPDFWWLRDWYGAIMDAPDIYGDYAVEKFCRRHAALDPVSITLLKVEVDGEVSPVDYAKGARPMQSEYSTTTTLKQAPCKR